MLYNPLRERTPVRLSAVLLALPAKLKEQVKAEFSKPITAVLASGKPETKDDLLVREQMDRAETFELQQAFDDYCWSFKRKWVAEKNGKSFKDLRDKRLAHIDVKLGRAGYQLQEIKGPD